MKTMIYRAFILLALLSALLTPAGAQTGEQPNFVFFITDDISPDEIGCYGGKLVKTPNIDRLAAGGVRFTNAYVATSSCSPSRCSYITGRYPHNHGAAYLHTELPVDQFMFPQRLRENGYYTALSGKNHMGNAVSAAFELISTGKGPGKEEDWVKIMRERPKDKPFFFWFASTDAHRPWNMDESTPTYDAKTVEPPPFLFNGPLTRQDFTGFYHEVSRTDFYLGELRRELERQGVADATIVIYAADNGRPFPRSKTRMYDSGARMPFVVAGPGVRSGVVSDSLVSAIDLAPTVLELAGLDQHPRIQGVSFVPLLRDPKAKTRDYLFAEHNWHVYPAHERMLRYKNWLYIRNAWPDRLNMCVEGDDTRFPAAQELWQKHAEGKLTPQQSDVFQVPRPAEELFDVIADPDQLRNLVDNPKHKDTLARMRSVMDQWVKETGDSTPPETPLNQNADIPLRYRGPHPEIMPGAEHGADQLTASGPVLE